MFIARESRASCRDSRLLCSPRSTKIAAPERARQLERDRHRRVESCHDSLSENLNDPSTRWYVVGSRVGCRSPTKSIFLDAGHNRWLPRPNLPYSQPVIYFHKHIYHRSQALVFDHPLRYSRPCHRSCRGDRPGRPRRYFRSRTRSSR